VVSYIASRPAVDGLLAWRGEADWGIRKSEGVVGGRTGAGVEVLSGTPPCEPTSYVNAGITGLPLLPASAIATVVARRRGVDALGAAHGRCGRRCDSGCARPATGATRAARVSMLALVTPFCTRHLHAAYRQSWRSRVRPCDLHPMHTTSRPIRAAAQEKPPVPRPRPEG
jgi:hypothetical protein